MNLRMLVKEINVLNLLGAVVVVAMAGTIQLTQHDLPCPLCLLQRIGLLAIGFGFLLNLRDDIRPSHYALSLLAALLTGATAIRQILLHIQPGSANYGGIVFGLSMYTWVFIISVAYIVIIGVMLLFDEQFKRHKRKNGPWMKRLIHLVFAFTLIVIGFNIVSTFLECGLSECPENPQVYKLLN